MSFTDEAKRALQARDFGAVIEVFEEFSAQKITPMPSALARFYTTAVLELDGGDAALRALREDCQGLTPDRELNVHQLLLLEIGTKALRDGDYELTLATLYPVKNWLNLGRHLNARALLIAAELALGSTSRASQLGCETVLGADAKKLKLHELENFFNKVLNTVRNLGNGRDSKPKIVSPTSWISNSGGRLPAKPLGAVKRQVLWTQSQLFFDIPELTQISGPACMQPIQSVTFHHASLQPGALFVPAITKDDQRRNQPNFKPRDQREVIRKAFQAGAVAAIVDDKSPGYDDMAPVYRCDNRVAVFKRLAQLGRNRLTGDVVGITGSFGKTTTREMTAQMLSHFAPTSTQIDNRNSLSGQCETLASVSSDTKDCVLELGISQPNTMLEATQLVEPDIAVLTTVVDSHLGNYENLEALLHEKARILEGCRGDRPALIGRTALNLDKHLQTGFFDSLEHLSIGTESKDDIQLLKYTIRDRQSHLVIRVNGEKIPFTMPVIGRPYAVAACFALGVAVLKDLPLEQAAQSMAGFTPLQLQRGSRWRMAPLREGTVFELLDDSQNATPPTTLALLEYLEQRQPARLVFVLGDMLDLGDDAWGKHLALLPALQKAKIGLFVGVGPLSKRLAGQLKDNSKTVAFETCEDAARTLPSLIRSGDLITLKGTGYSKLHILKNALARPNEQTPIHSSWRIEDDHPDR